MKLVISTFKHSVHRFALALIAAFAWFMDMFSTPALALSNTDETTATDQNIGVHEDSIQGYVTAGISSGEKYRHLLYTMAADGQHFVVCGATDKPLGTIDNHNVASTDKVTLLLWNQNKTTRKCVAAGAISLNNGSLTPVYAAAAGQVAATGSVLVGYALTAAAAQYGIIEVIPVAPYGGVKVPLFAGTYTTTGGAASEDITGLTGMTSANIIVATLRQKGGTPRTILTALAATDKITLTFSGDPSTDHKVDYVVFG